MGWGQVLQTFFNTACAKVEDKAISGRSSKSFYDEGAWTPVVASIKEGDYVMIQFGHNDEKEEDRTRYTNPNTTFPEYLTKYISQTRDKGGIPILMTPLNRNKWDGTVLQDTHGEYPDAIRKLAEEQDTPLVDVTELTKIYFEEIGPAATTKLFMNLAPGQFPRYPLGNEDNTHLQEEGAKTISQIIVADLYEQNLPIAALLKEIPTIP
jgi:lysophospholipase L1-like esterase